MSITRLISLKSSIAEESMSFVDAVNSGLVEKKWIWEDGKLIPVRVCGDRMCLDSRRNIMFYVRRANFKYVIKGLV